MPYLNEILTACGILVAVVFGVLGYKKVSRRHVGRDSHEVSINAQDSAKISHNIVAGRDVRRD